MKTIERKNAYTKSVNNIAAELHHKDMATHFVTAAVMNLMFLWLLQLPFAFPHLTVHEKRLQHFLYQSLANCDNLHHMSSTHSDHDTRHLFYEYKL